MNAIDNIYFVRKLNAPDNPIVHDLIAAITIKAAEHGINIIPTLPEDVLELRNLKTLVISVGGDGTMLQAMRISSKYSCACTGFHAGKLGFLNDFSATTNIDDSIHQLFQLLTDQVIFYSYLENRIPIRVSLLNNVRSTINPPLSFNEVAISRLYSDQILEYDLCIDGEYLGTHRSNSLLISTPTGSTAYSLSAGGSIILPHAEVLQIVPVAPNTLASRPLIIPIRHGHNLVQVDVKPLNIDAAMRIDGMKIELHEQLTSITVEAGPVATILHNPKWSFFNTLATKLGWLKQE